MEQLSKNYSRILSFSFVMMIISAFAVFIIGNSSIKISREIKGLSLFLLNARNLQSNFETSLYVYTETTQGIIHRLLSLRPDNEEDLIQFISKVENIGENLALQLTLQTLESEASAETIAYKVTFFGNQKNLIRFLEELETLSYYVRVTEVNYEDPDLQSDENINKRGNISLVINLYKK